MFGSFLCPGWGLDPVTLWCLFGAVLCPGWGLFCPHFAPTLYAVCRHDPGQRMHSWYARPGGTRGHAGALLIHPSMHKPGHTRGAFVQSICSATRGTLAGVRYPLLRYRGSLANVGTKPTKTDNALSFYDPNFLGARPGQPGRARQQQQTGHENTKGHALAGDHGRARVVVVARSARVPLFRTP